MFKVRSLFYQANFCAECGVEIEKRRRWRPLFFCDHCTQQKRLRSILTPGILIVIILAIIIILFRRGPEPTSVNSRPTVSAFDASPRQAGPQSVETVAKVICGARTKKGTPCRHLVLPGQRCPQHRGKPSILK